jgi:hypothetical protein
MNGAPRRIRAQGARAVVRAALSLGLLLAACGESDGKETTEDDIDASTDPVSGADADAPAMDAASASPSDAGSTSSSDGSAPTQVPEAAAPIEQSDYEVAKTLIGSYAARIKYRDNVTVGVAGSGSLVTTTFATAEVRDDPAAKEVRLEMTLCDSRSAAPEKHVADLVVTMSEASLKQTKLGPIALKATRSAGAVRWEVDGLLGAAGWKPASPTDAPPTVWDDPRIFDQDGDGEPGVTADYGGMLNDTSHEMGTLHLAVAYRFRFSGDVAADGELTGATTSGTEEILLGSSEAVLVLTGATIVRKAEPDPANNTVRLKHQTSALTCAQVIAQKATLFP